MKKVIEIKSSLNIQLDKKNTVILTNIWINATLGEMLLLSQSYNMANILQNCIPNLNLVQCFSGCILKHHEFSFSDY